MNDNNNDIKEITRIINVGKGPFDKIGIHRITRYENEDNSVTVIMIPGSNSDFNTSFYNMARFLANRGIDVWGIDFRYSFVPNDINSNPYCLVEDCSFFKDQNTALHLSDLDIVVKIVEMTTRKGKVFLLGFSQGAYFAYKYADGNANLMGIIPVDIAYNIDPQSTDYIANARIDVEARLNKIANGIFYEDRLTEKFLVTQAAQSPDTPSPVIPGLTNMQVLLFALTGFSMPGFRYNQGTLAGLTHTDVGFMITQVQKLNSFQSMLPLLEVRQQYLEPIPIIPIISVPILHVAAEFGFGTFGFYTPDKISEFNNDVTKLLIPTYGHADMIYSNTAQTDVWDSISKWIKQHSED